MNKLLKKHFPTYYAIHQNQSGVVFVTVLIVGLLLTFIGLSLANVALTQLRRTNENVFVSNALLVAEAGVEQSIFEINASDSFTGFDEEVEFYSNEIQGRGTFQTSITPGSGPNERVITSIGRTYRNGSDKVEKERRVRITIVGTSSPGYSVQAGAGGLILSGSARITNSQVYVNGYIDLKGAASIGTASQPLDIFVANANCPPGNNPGPAYPQVCATGEPITFETSTKIYGNVCATGQTSIRVAPWQTVPVIEGGNGGQGLIAGCTAPPVPMPFYDRNAHISSMTIASPSNNIDYNCSQWRNPDGFVRTWPANLRLNGNVSIASSCDLTITGNVYITGDLTIGGAARIRIADSLGTTRPVIVIDGKIEAGGSATIIPNSSGTSAHLISFKSSAACSPNCTNITGTELKQSQNLLTIDVAGAGNFPGTIFHAYWSKVKLGGSGNLGSAIGQTIDLSGAGTITFGTALSTGESTWTVRSYQYDFE